MLTEEQRRRAWEIIVGQGRGGNVTGTEFESLMSEYLREKATLGPNEVHVTVRNDAEIIRDQRGVPHIKASDPYDLFFAFGYAHGQDRLWQLDFLRRHAYGRLSEVYGPEKLESDILSHTLGIGGLARESLERSASESRAALTAFADGLNAWMNHLPGGLPIEFEILGYEPEPWRPEDSLAIFRRWLWYLTGRLNVISTPEAVRAGIGDGSLYEAFFAPDGEVAYIVPEGAYDPTLAWPDRPADPAGVWLGGVAEPGGSNNWVAAPSITASGDALLASDPHVYFTVPTDWFEVHLHGACYDVIGMTYPGLPAVLFGRNQHVAWGITNNICSLRDLYVEEVQPNDPTRYRHDGEWAPFTERTESIGIRGEDDYQHVTRYAHSRPVVDHLLPEGALPRNLWSKPEAQQTVLSLAWVGFEMSDEPQCLLDLDRAASLEEAREAVRSWRIPTFNLVLADDRGSVGYQAAGAIPLRGREHRGYRDANDPVDAWQSVIPFDGLPRYINPERGWVASANNPTAPPDFPYPLSGTWAPEDRAPRAEQLLEERKPHTLETFAAMQNDVYSGRAARGTPALLSILGDRNDRREREAIDELRGWDFELTTTTAAGAIFYVFFWRWHHHVVRQRFPEALVPLVQDSGWGLTSDLLQSNIAGWFPDDGAREETVRTAFQEALDWLEARFGPELDTWEWGKIHLLGAVHPAARTDLQHDLLDIPSRPHPGGASTLASAFYNPPGAFATRLGANYRMLASLGEGQEIQVISWPGQSGQPGSAHYADQVDAYMRGEYEEMPFDWRDVEASASAGTRLRPE
jgi:penicillin G amidase